MSQTSFPQLADRFSGYTVSAAYAAGSGGLAVTPTPPFTLSGAQWARLTITTGPPGAEAFVTHLRAGGLVGSTFTGVTAMDGYADVPIGVGANVSIRASAELLNSYAAAINGAEARLDGHDSAIAGLAADASVVHLAGAETITGAKTFSTPPILGSLAGLIKGASGSLSAAAVGTDYYGPGLAIPQAAVSGLTASLAALAPLASPALTGSPTAPTASPGDNSTKVATTAFVLANVPSSGVTSFNTRTGAVVLQASDLPATGVTHGTYNNPTIYVDDSGRIVTAVNGTAPSSSLAIGSAVTGGTSTSLLIVDASGNLDQNANLTYDASTQFFKVGSAAIHATGPTSFFAGALAGNTAITSTYGNNTGVGVGALHGLTTGFYNTAIGKGALASVQDGSRNIGIGTFAGQGITSGQNNIAIGDTALQNLTTGQFNIGIGEAALSGLTTSSTCVAIGASTFGNLTTGGGNTALGSSIFTANNGNGNTGIGQNIFIGNTGSNNIGIGQTIGDEFHSAANDGVIAMGFANWFAVNATDLYSYSVSLGYEANRYRSGQYSVAIGYHAGFNDGSTAITGDNCVLVGANSNVGGGFTKSIALGYNALASQSNACALGGTGADSVDVGINTATPSAKIHAVCEGPAKKGLVVQGAASQTADLLQWQSSAPSVLGAIKADGSIGLPSIADSAATNGSLYFSATTSKLTYKDPSGTLHAV